VAAATGKPMEKEEYASKRSSPDVWKKMCSNQLPSIHI